MEDAERSPGDLRMAKGLLGNSSDRSVNAAMTLDKTLYTVRKDR